jgi:hypothetical protein
MLFGKHSILALSSMLRKNNTLEVLGVDLKGAPDECKALYEALVANQSLVDVETTTALVASLGKERAEQIILQLRVNRLRKGTGSERTAFEKIAKEYDNTIFPQENKGNNMMRKGTNETEPSAVQIESDLEDEVKGGEGKRKDIRNAPHEGTRPPSPSPVVSPQRKSVRRENVAEKVTEDDSASLLRHQKKPFVFGGHNEVNVGSEGHDNERNEDAPSPFRPFSPSSAALAAVPVPVDDGLRALVRQAIENAQKTFHFPQRVYTFLATEQAHEFKRVEEEILAEGKEGMHHALASHHRTTKHFTAEELDAEKVKISLALAQLTEDAEQQTEQRLVTAICGGCFARVDELADALQPSLDRFREAQRRHATAAARCVTREDVALELCAFTKTMNANMKRELSSLRREAEEQVSSSAEAFHRQLLDRRMQREGPQLATQRFEDLSRQRSERFAKLKTNTTERLSAFGEDLTNDAQINSLVNDVVAKSTKQLEASYHEITKAMAGFERDHTTTPINSEVIQALTDRLSQVEGEITRTREFSIDLLNKVLQD